MKYISIKETSEKWGISTRRIQILCKQDRIPGAFHVGNSWAIPENAEKPKDQRIKSGKYIKHNHADFYRYEILICAQTGIDDASKNGLK